MMKIVKKGFSFLLVIVLNVNFLNLSTFAENGGFDKCRALNGMIHDNLNCYFDEAKEQIKAGASHITVKNEKNIPNQRLEFFRYTALDEVVPSLLFEIEPNKFIQDKYGKTFSLAKKIGTGIGAVVGAIVMPLYIKALYYVANKRNKNVQDESNKIKEASEKLADINKKSNQGDKWVKLFFTILGSGVFAFLGKTFAEYMISNFELKEHKKLFMKKRNALMAMESAVNHISDEDWKYGHILYIHENQDLDTYEATTNFLSKNNSKNSFQTFYLENEVKSFPQAFEKLKNDLTKILNDNVY